MAGLLNRVNLVHTMSIDIIKFAVAMQKYFLKCGFCNIYIVQQCWNVTNLVKVCFTKIILKIMIHTVNRAEFQFQFITLTITTYNIKHTYFIL